MTVLNQNQFNRITKRFAGTGDYQIKLSHPYLIDNQIIATNGHIAVLFNQHILDFKYEPQKMDTKILGTMDSIITNTFGRFNADTSLKLSKMTIQTLIKFLKDNKKTHKEYGYPFFKVEISYIDKSLDFKIEFLDTDGELTQITHTIHYTDIRPTPYYDKRFTVMVSLDCLVNALMTLRETDNESTLNFTTDPLRPIMFENSMLQVLLLPVKA